MLWRHFTFSKDQIPNEHFNSSKRIQPIVDLFRTTAGCKFLGSQIIPINNPKETTNKAFRALKREDPFTWWVQQQATYQPKVNRFFSPAFFLRKKHQPQGSLPPTPAQKPNQAFVCWLVGLWRWHIAWSFPRHHGSCGSSRFTGNQWLRGGNSVLDGALDQGSLHGPPKVGPLPISFPYNSYTSRDSYGSGMGVVWEWGVPLLGLREWSSGELLSSKWQNWKVCCVCYLVLWMVQGVGQIHEQLGDHGLTSGFTITKTSQISKFVQDTNLGVICGSYIQSSFLTPPLKTHIIPENWWLLQMIHFLSNKNQVVSNIFNFHPIWGRFPFWLTFFKGVETAN